MAEKSCADAIVGLMESYGIDTIFGIPGVHTVAFYRALVSSGLRHVTPRHEQGAARDRSGLFGFWADAGRRCREQE